MADSGVTYKELRFIIEDELTQVYVRMDLDGDYMPGIQGWHHKTFPPSKNVAQILEEMFTKDSCILWPQQAPPIE